MKGIIFDLDGTMVDNMMVHHRAWQETLSRLGLDLTLEEVMKKVHGINEEIIERLFGERFGLQERKRISKEKEAQYRSIFQPDLKLVDGLDQFLNSCKTENLALGVATAAPVENLDFVLDNLNIRNQFDVTLHAGDVERGKPDPEVFLKAADRLNLSPEECLIFEDSPTGARAAANAGIKTIVVTTTHKTSDFNEIPVAGFIQNFHKLDLNSARSIHESKSQEIKEL